MNLGNHPVDSFITWDEASIARGGLDATAIIRFAEPVTDFDDGSLITYYGTFSNLRQTDDTGMNWAVDIHANSYKNEVRLDVVLGSYWGVSGNSGSGSISYFMPVAPPPDTTAPDHSTTSIDIHAVTADGVVNQAEKAKGVVITGQVKGEFQAGDVVTLTLDGKKFTAKVNDKGEYHVNVPSEDIPADGQYTVFASVAASDKAGNVNKVGDIKAEKEFSVDTVVEGALKLQNFVDSANPHIADSNHDLISNDNNFVLNFVTAEKGAKVVYQEKINGQWQDVSAEQNQVADGTHEYRAVVTDAAGNTTQTDSVKVVIDTVANDAPLDVIKQNGVITGTTEAGSVLILRDADGVEVAHTLADAQGHFSFDAANLKANGFTVVSVDTAGNQSDATEVENIGLHHQVYTAASGFDASSSLKGYADVVTTNGDDWIEIGNGGRDCWTVGTHGDIWNADPAAGWAILDTGAGNDRIDTGVGGGSGDMLAYTVVHMGEGNDTLNLKGAIVNNAIVEMGGGDDVANIGHYLGTYTQVDMGAGNDTLLVQGDVLSTASVYMGEGNDTLTVNGHIWGAYIDMGEGDDTFVYTNKTIDGFIEGGAGNDTLVLDYQGDNSMVNGILAWKNITNVSTHEFTGFENVKLAGNNVLDVRYNDLVNDDTRSGSLFIQGNENSKVDLGSTNWNSDGANRANLRDAGGGTWESTGNQTVDGVEYTVYHHSFATDTLNDVYIQTGVTVI